VFTNVNTHVYIYIPGKSIHRAIYMPQNASSSSMEVLLAMEIERNSLNPCLSQLSRDFNFLFYVAVYVTHTARRGARLAEHSGIHIVKPAARNSRGGIGIHAYINSDMPRSIVSRNNASTAHWSGFSAPDMGWLRSVGPIKL